LSDTSLPPDACSSTIFGWFEKFPTCALIYKSVSLPKQHSLAKGDVRFWPLAGIAQMSLSRVKADMAIALRNACF
jgi:hypothetical protein